MNQQHDECRDERLMAAMVSFLKQTLKGQDALNSHRPMSLKA
jgi:hypothetical protein